MAKADKPTPPADPQSGDKPAPPADTQSSDNPAPPVNTQSGDKLAPPMDTHYLRPKRYEDKGKIADDPDDPGGYQTERVGKRLDQLEREGIVLNHYTVMELRRLLEQKFKNDEAPPSRQTINRVIKRRLA